MDEAAAANQQENENRGFFNIEYFRDTWEGRLKIVEFICLLLAAALVPASVYGHEAGFGFMSFVAWTAFICTLVDCFIHLIRDVWDRLTYIRDYPEIYLSLCLVGAVVVGLGSVTELAIATHAENPNMARASGFFGFFCVIAFAVESYLHYQSYKQRSQERLERQERSGTTEQVFSDINTYDA